MIYKDLPQFMSLSSLEQVHIGTAHSLVLALIILLLLDFTSSAIVNSIIKIKQQHNSLTILTYVVSLP